MEDVAPRSIQVLVIDDEKHIRSTVGLLLESQGCQVVGAATSAAALAAMAKQRFDLALLDLKLGNESGLELLPRLLAEDASLLVVMITAFAQIDTAVEAMRRGAWDFLPKPFEPEHLLALLRKATERRTLASTVANLSGRLADAAPEVELSSASPRMRAVFEILERAASSDAPVLLRGENGTGKGVLARALHARSARAGRPFVVVNCPTLSEDLLASELFGHTRGAFTGAVSDQAGRVEAAQGGTLMLDEIGEIPPGLQAKLLRFAQDHEFERIGDSKTRRADVRIVAATNRDLEADVRAGRFREDLLFRLNVVELTVPALRERPEDVLPLARHFLDFFVRASGRPPASLSPAAEAALQAYSWPGNVRELRNTMERALILWPARVIEPAAFPARVAAGADKAKLELGGDYTLDEVEKAHIQAVVARAATLDDAARLLGIDASTLWRKRKKYEEG